MSVASVSRPRLVTAEGFVTAVLAAVHLARISPLSFRGTAIDEAFEAVGKACDEKAGDWGIEMGFEFILHPLHGDCSTLRDILMHLANLGVVEYRSSDMFRFAGAFTDGQAKGTINRMGLPVDDLVGLVSEHFAKPPGL